MRTVGVDDGAFSPNRSMGKALLVATLFDGARLADVRISRITVDGTDANDVLESMVRRLSFDALILSGISFGGFNLVDMAKLAKKVRKPVIAVTGDRPNNSAVKQALRAHFPDWRRRWRVVLAAGQLYSFRPLRSEPRLYFEVRGAPYRSARAILARLALISRLPEPVRVARILARGLSEFRLNR